jgi:hypothetical protein
VSFSPQKAARDAKESNREGREGRKDLVDLPHKAVFHFCCLAGLLGEDQLIDFGGISPGRFRSDKNYS